MNPSASLIHFVLRSMFGWLNPALGAVRPVRSPGSRIEYAAPMSRRSDAELVIGIIDDPELVMRLLSVRGELTSETLDSLAHALDEVKDEAILHLDVTDTKFTDPYAFADLAGLLDELEDRRVKVRIVGLNRLRSDSFD